VDRSLYQPSPWSAKYHETTCDQVLGGGAAGPGKSLTLLWDPIVTQAIVEHARMTGQLLDQFPEWLADLCKKHPIRQGESEGHALHMRRTMPQLQETIDRSMRMFKQFDPHASYSKELHRWEFSSGYKYTFGHCRESNSHEDYLSKQYTHLSLDEAFQFEEKQYEELDGRVRTADPVLKHFKRTRLMSNPAPGWLKDTFVTPERKGNVILKRKVLDPETGEWEWKTQLFLPATLDDNPDKGFVRDYKFKLLSKPAHMRARYLYGDWDSVEGGYFEDDYNPGVHIITPFKIPRDWPKFRVMDWGYKTHGTCGWFALDPDENLYLFYEFNFRLMKDVEVAKRIEEIERNFGFWDKRENKSRLLSSVADTQLWEERGDSGKSKAAVFADHGIFWEPADKASIQRNAERVAERLRDYDDKRPPALMIFENCKKTREMLASIKVDENDSLIPDKKSPLKHWFDIVGYGAARASRGRGSIVMELHEFDRPDNDNADEPLPKASGFGYGS
jgi:phage terminase large subunit